MFVPWWVSLIAVALVISVAYLYNRLRTLRLRKEIARLKSQVEREQEFSNQLISLMPEDREEPR
jgi:cell division protein FtsL